MSNPGLLETLRTRLKIALSPARADESARSALNGDDAVAVSVAKNIELRPDKGTPTAGIILYPGGRCEAASYAPLMHAFARRGYLCIIADMPIDMAVFSPDRAADIIKTHPEIQRWYMMGHSLGGAMAARFAMRNSEKISGLFLLGSYPPESVNLSACKFPVTLLYGSEDTFATPEKILNAKDRTPPHAQFIGIEGGDHYQFGSFKDAIHTASISREAQQQQVISQISQAL
ncbi:MAG: alpha/beta hydrolase [Gammaproteobacteria bacterium]|nr:alpha/beta hydrolase [Gammaproteobacteria bacterium]